MKRTEYCKNETELVAIFATGPGASGPVSSRTRPSWPQAPRRRRCTIHGTTARSPKLCLLELDCYASGTTRTISLSGRFEGEAKILYFEERVFSMHLLSLVSAKKKIQRTSGNFSVHLFHLPLTSSAYSAQCIVTNVSLSRPLDHSESDLGAGPLLNIVLEP